MLDRIPSDGQPVGYVFRRDEQAAIIELFRLVRVSREPQTYFAPAGGRVPARDQIWNIDAYPVFTAGRGSYILVLAEQTGGKVQARQRGQLEAERLRPKANQLPRLGKGKAGVPRP